MIEDSREKPLADPDFFDVLIQSLSVLSNIAALVATWKLLQPQQRPANAHNQGMIRDQLRTVERCFDDVFEARATFCEYLRGRLNENENPLFAKNVLDLVSAST